MKKKEYKNIEEIAAEKRLKEVKGFEGLGLYIDIDDDNDGYDCY